MLEISQYCGLVTLKPLLLFFVFYFVIYVYCMLSLPVDVFFFGYFTFVFRIMKVHCLVYWCLCKLKKNIKLAR